MIYMKAGPRAKESLWEAGRKKDPKKGGQEEGQRGVILQETPVAFLFKQKFLTFWTNLAANGVFGQVIQPRESSRGQEQGTDTKQLFRRMWQKQKSPQPQTAPGYL